MNVNRHLEEEEIEQYSLRSTPESDLERVEEHLLVCSGCRNRVEESDAYTAAMRDAGRELRQIPEKRSFGWRVLVPAFAIAVLAIAAAALFPLRTGEKKMPLAVTLSALRGTAGEAKAPAGQVLDLRLDLTGLSDAAANRIDVVDQTGKVVAMAALPMTRVNPLPAGTYFVRLYSRGGELLREYGLQVEARK